MANDLKGKGKRIMTMTAGRHHFVDNAEFKYELECRRIIVQEALARGEEPPRLSESIGRKLLMVAEALAHRPYFIGYSYREDMVMTAMYDCVKYVDKFDTSRGTSAFAYFTQTCWYAFIRYIQSEKKQSYVKVEIIKNLGTILQDLQIDSQDADQDFKNHITELLNQATNSDLEKTFGKKKKDEPILDGVDVDPEAGLPSEEVTADQYFSFGGESDDDE